MTLARTKFHIALAALGIVVIAGAFGSCSRNGEELSGPAPPATDAVDPLTQAESKLPRIISVDEAMKEAHDPPAGDLPFGRQEAVEVYFDDFENGEGGWVPFDMTAQEGVFWQRATYFDDEDDEEVEVMWCGTDSPCLATPPGYGNTWIQDLSKSCTLPAGPLELRYKIQYDMEPGYDFVHLEISTDGGGSFETLEQLTGVSDGFELRTVDLSANAGEEAVLRFRFKSDGGWSDADGLLPTDGACRLAQVRLKDATGVLFNDSFATGNDGWVASAGPSIGGGPFRLETELAGLGDGQNHAWAAYDLDTGEFPYTPEDALWPPLEIGIESPVISIPGDGLAYVLEFDVYRDLPLYNLVFFRWELATSFPGDECWNYVDVGYIFYGTGGWFDFVWDVTEFVTPGATEMKIRLTGYDGRFFEYWGIPYSGVHSPAPFFDNVRFTVEMP